VVVALASDTGQSASDRITANPTLIGSGDANVGVAISEGGVLLGTTTADAAGNWVFAPGGLGDGAHTVTATETDIAGNIGQGSLSLSVDTAPAGVSLALAHDTGASASDRLTADPTLAGTGDPNTRVTISEGGAVLGATTTDGAGNWTFTP